MKKFISLLLVLCLVFCFAACGGGGGGTEPEPTEEDTPVTLVVGNVAADTGLYTQALNKAQEWLTEHESTVSLDIQINSILGSEPEMVQNTSAGIQDMVQAADMSYTGLLPALAFSNFPGLFADYDGMREAWKQGGWCYQIADEALATVNLKLLGAGDNGFRIITNSKRPVEKIEDIAGLKIRVPENKLLLEIWGKLGAVAAPIAFGELATALQQGTVDGQELNASNFYTYRWDEFNKYMTLTNYDYSACLTCINADKFASLSEKQQQDLLDAFAYAADWHINYTEEYTNEGLEVMQADGLQVLEATEEMKDYFYELGYEIAHEDEWMNLLGEDMVNKMYPSETRQK